MIDDAARLVWKEYEDKVKEAFRLVLSREKLSSYEQGLYEGFLIGAGKPPTGSFLSEIMRKTEIKRKGLSHEDSKTTLQE
jgi:hypothetical protein